MLREKGHDWSGCRCKGCGEEREEGHNYKGCECTICSKTSHEFVEGRCYRCRVFAIDWVQIPAGSFVMGSPLNEVGRGQNCESQHYETLIAFKMSRYEITFAQYDAFCEATNRNKPSDNGWGRGNRPVINVNSDDADAFALWMGGRLPSEAEWEYACRAGTTTSFHTGNILSTTQANFGNTSKYSLLIEEIANDLTRTQVPKTNNPNSESYGKTMPVGSFPPNAWGLYDMHGNVEEWTCTYWAGDYPTINRPNSGRISREILIRRGGNWQSSASDCRSASREANFTENIKRNYIGFRIVEGRRY